MIQDVQSQHSNTSAMSYPDSTPCKVKRVHRKNKNAIVLNISDCQYPVVTKVAKEFGWKLQSSSEAKDWDVCWTDNAVQAETLLKMELHQKINHFPGMFNLARKNLLGRGLMKMKKQFNEEYNFFPMTWMLPIEYNDLKTYYESKTKGKARTFIVKPECMSQGKGIFLTRKLQDIVPGTHCVVQRYLHRPYLVQGLKFDLRIYVLVTSIDPLTIYLYEQGLARFATEKYEAPNRENMEDVCMHLTNYAINKDNPKFVFNSSQKDMSKGHKRSLTSILELMKSQGVDTDKLMARIKDSIIKTMISGLPSLVSTYHSCQPQNHSANMCFQLLGFDIMITQKCQPVLLEINHTPSFTTDTPLDTFIKFNYIKDALVLMNINQRQRNDIIRQRKLACQQRVITGKKIRLNDKEKQILKSKAVADKEKYELNHLGRFERLYPVTGQDDPYQKYIDYVMEMQQTMTGPRRQKVIEKNQKEIFKPANSKTTFRKSLMSTTSELARRQNLARKEDERLQASREEQKLEVSDNMLSEHGSEQFVKSIQQGEQTKANDNTFEDKPLIKSKTPAHGNFEKHKYTSDKVIQQNVKTKSQNFIIQILGFPDRRLREKSSLRVPPTHKQKIPIALNTLMINGLDYKLCYPINSFKGHLLNNRSKQ